MATRKRLTITFYPPMDTMAWAHGPSKQWLGNSVETPRRKPNKVVSSCRNWLRNSSAAVVESPEIYGTSVVANPMVLEFLKRDDWTHVAESSGKCGFKGVEKPWHILKNPLRVGKMNLSACVWYGRRTRLDKHFSSTKQMSYNAPKYHDSGFCQHLCHILKLPVAKLVLGAPEN